MTDKRRTRKIHEPPVKMSPMERARLKRAVQKVLHDRSKSKAAQLEALDARNKGV